MRPPRPSTPPRSAALEALSPDLPPPSPGGSCSTYLLNPQPSLRQRVRGVRGFCSAARRSSLTPAPLQCAGIYQRSAERTGQINVKRMSASGHRGWTGSGQGLCCLWIRTNDAPASACNSRKLPGASTTGQHGGSSPCAGCGCQTTPSGFALACSRIGPRPVRAIRRRFTAQQVKAETANRVSSRKPSVG
jgi:hypothetical protein